MGGGIVGAVASCELPGVESGDSRKAGLSECACGLRSTCASENPGGRVVASGYAELSDLVDGGLRCFALDFDSLDC